MKKILYFFSFFLAFNVHAKEVIVTAYGEGDDYDWAVLNAVENAVRQTSDVTIEGKGLRKVDVSVTAEGQISHDLTVNATERKGLISNEQSLSESENVKASSSASFKNNSKEIPAEYKGTVSAYEVIEHNQENGKHKVMIKATIIKDDVYDAHDYKSKSLVKKSDYTLAIMPFKIGQVNCLGQKADTQRINKTLSSLFIEKLAPSRKFTLVDRNNFDDYAAEMALIEQDMTLPENKVKLKNIAAADYILVGSVDNFSASTAKEYIALTGETNYSSSSKLKISYRLLEAATMEIISVGSVEKTFNKEGTFSSCANVEALLAEKAVSVAAEQILTDIFPDYQAPKAEVNVKSSVQIKRSANVQKTDYSLPLY